MFEAADARLELLMRQATGWEQDSSPSRASGSTHHRPSRRRTAGVRRPRPRSRCGSARSASSRRARATARSTPSTTPCGPACNEPYPALDQVHLTDYKVRILDGEADTGAVTRCSSTRPTASGRGRRSALQNLRGFLAGLGRLARFRPLPVGPPPTSPPPAPRAVRVVDWTRKRAMRRIGALLLLVLVTGCVGGNRRPRPTNRREALTLDVYDAQPPRGSSTS